MIQDRQNNIRQFEEHEEYDEFSGSTAFTKPNVSHCVEEEHVHYNPLNISMDEDKVVVTYSSATTYNGQVQGPTSIVVKIGDDILVEGVDYIISGNTGGTNAGVYTFTIVGIGNYTGERTCTYTIKSKTVTTTIELPQSAFTYTGNAIKPTVIVKDGSDVIDPSEYNVSYSNNVNVGSAATLTVSDKSGGNYKITNGSKTFQINKANRTLSWVTAPATVYAGTSTSIEAKPSLGVGDGTITYTSSNTSRVNVSGSTIQGLTYGTAVITAKISEGVNCKAAQVTYTVTVNEREYVDLGLPSKTMWAKANLGASRPLQAGDYFKYGDGNRPWNKPYCTSSRYLGMEDPLKESLDAVVQAWGGGWHTPSYQEFIELISYTNKELVTVKDTDGRDVVAYKFTRKGNANYYIYLPVAGEVVLVGGCAGASVTGYGTFMAYLSRTPCPDPSRTGANLKGYCNYFRGTTSEPVNDYNPQMYAQSTENAFSVRGVKVIK